MLPGIGQFLFHSQGPVIGARWQIKHVKPFLRCLFSGPPPPVKQLSSVISSKLLICLQLLTGFCLGPPLCWSQNHEARRVQSVPRQLPQGAFSKFYLFLTVQLTKLYPKPSNLPQGLNFGILEKRADEEWVFQLICIPPPRSFVILGIQFSREILDCKLVHKFDHTHTEKDSFANLEIGAQVVSL